MRSKHKSTTSVADIYQAKKRLFVLAIVLKSDGIQVAARKSGFSIPEAKAFHQTAEFTQMSTYLWDRYVKRELDCGGRELFITVTTALRKLNRMVKNSTQEVQLKAIAELRQWISNGGKSPMLDRMTSGMLDVSEKEDDDGEMYTPGAARIARDLLTEIRVLPGGRSGRRNGT